MKNIEILGNRARIKFSKKFYKLQSLEEVIEFFGNDMEAVISEDEFNHIVTIKTENPGEASLEFCNAAILTMKNRGEV